MLENDFLLLGGRKFKSRFFVGTGKLPSPAIIKDIIKESGSELVTVALRRVNFEDREHNILEYIPESVVVAINTSGARNADEAIRIARIAREAGCSNFVKIEVIHDMKYLFPDNDETVKATYVLAKEGFVVLPYVLPDFIIAKKLEDAGASAIMPLGSPIGSNQGLKTKELIEIIIENTTLPVIVDAGIGKPSHAAEAMELGAAAVLVNTAIATSEDPVMAAKAFALGVEAGRMAYIAKMREEQKLASASSPLTGFLR
ncbi:MAG: thiazole synthase [Brevinematia bacterium]